MKALAEPRPARKAGTRRVQERHILEALLRSMPDAIVSVDLQGRIRLFNPAAERMFGCSRASVQGEPVELLIPGHLREEHHEAMQRFAVAPGESRMMGLHLVKGLRADGQVIDLEGVISHAVLPTEHWLLVCLRDVTARVQNENQLQASRAQLAELTRRFMTQEQMLVKRLAQGLHDQLGQTMAAIRMCHDTLLTLQPAVVSVEHQRSQERMGALIGQAITQVRQVLVDLRPPLLDRQGLSAALDNELRNRAQAAPTVDIIVHFPSELNNLRWPTDVEYAAFMVVREAIENALRHSGASTIAVNLLGDALLLDLSVQDNGVGLPKDAPSSHGHLGMLSMQERAQAVGASVGFEGGAGAGTQVNFHWKGVP